MGTWHYQIQERADMGQKFYDIVEVYSDGSRTVNGIRPGGDTPEELIQTLERMLSDARHREVLTIEDKHG
jgi:hypothetical protein